jgi:hypothetical protein
MENKKLYILQVKNLRKYDHYKWITLHTIIDIKEYKNIDIALEVTLREFDHIRKERDNLPLEFRFVKIKIDTKLNTIPLTNGEEILEKIKNE